MTHRKSMLLAGVLLVAGVAAAVAAPAAGATLSNNLASGYSDIGPSNIFTLNNACGCDPTWSSAAIDSFTLGSAAHLTSVKAALIEVNQNDPSYSVAPHFGGFDKTNGYQVNIYSSAAAAASNLTGDVYSTTIAPTSPGFGAPLDLPARFANFSSDSSLATFGIDKKLGAGTYWLSVIGLTDPDVFGQESIFIGLAGTGNAKLANPGGSWGTYFGPGTLFNFTDLGGASQAGYAVFGSVPEPASWALLIAGFGLTGAAMRRRVTLATVAA